MLLGQTESIYPRAESSLSPGPCSTSKYQQKVDVNTVVAILHNRVELLLEDPGNMCVFTFLFYIHCSGPLSFRVLSLYLKID